MVSSGNSRFKLHQDGGNIFEDEDEALQRIIMIIGYNNSSMRVWEGREGLVNKRNITSSMGMRIGEFRI